MIFEFICEVKRFFCFWFRLSDRLLEAVRNAPIKFSSHINIKEPQYLLFEMTIQQATLFSYY